MMTDNPHIAARLEALYYPGLKTIELSLGRMERFLALLGNPHKKLPPVIHVAGTNGKGSLLAYLYAIFQASGYTPHRYTSPHLIRFNERIAIAGENIGDDYLDSLLDRIHAAVEQQPVTFFEATTALAFLAFSEHKAEVTLLETGMGGRLDSTNVVEQPALTAITPVSLDHCDYLGHSLAAVAREKAGILKRGVPCVVGRQQEEAMRVIADHASALHVPLFRLGKEWQADVPFVLGLDGAHQRDNAATAIACIKQLPQFSITAEHIEKGLQQVVWPARLQRLQDHPFQSLLPPQVALWLDGGHNPQGGEVLAAWIKEQGREAHLVCGMVKDKDTVAYLKPLADCITTLTAVAIPDEPDSKRAGEIMEAARMAGIAATQADSLEKALQSVGARAKNSAIVVMCGSLYLAGRVLAVKEAYDVTENHRRSLG